MVHIVGLLGGWRGIKPRGSPMAFILVEDIDSPEFTVSPDNPRTVRRFTLSGGGENDLAASTFFESNITPFYFGLILQDYTLQHQGSGVYRATATYGMRQRLQPATPGTGSQSGPGGGTGGPAEVRSSNFQFDTTGMTATMKYSLETVATYPMPGRPVKDFLGGINCDSDNLPQGVEIVYPQFTFSIQRLIRAPLSNTMLSAIFGLTGCVNSDTVVMNEDGVSYIFQPGELLFLGATGGRRGHDEYDLTFRFVYSPNVTGLNFGSGANQIGPVSKSGHDYLWVKYLPTEEAGLPRQVNIERVYKRATLGVLFL